MSPITDEQIEYRHKFVETLRILVAKTYSLAVAEKVTAKAENEQVKALQELCRIVLGCKLTGDEIKEIVT